MARIRSIKPEFFRDEKVANLPKATALFFIGLWTIADDQGIFSIDSRTLSLHLPIYRSQDIHKMVKALWQEGLIMCSPGDGIGMVTGWRHQKIDRPYDGKWKDKDIKWLTWSDSSNDRDHSSNVRRKDLDLGSRKDLDLDSRRGKKSSDSEITKTAAPVVSKLPTPAQELVGSYVMLWQKRYPNRGRPPLRPQDTKALKQLSEQNGSERVKALLEAFLRMPDPWFVKKRHDLATFTNNLTAVADFMSTGQVISQSELKQLDGAIEIQNTLKALREGSI